MRAVLRKELNQTIAEPESPKALLSGSDVFFTGREFFIGLSNHCKLEIVQCDQSSAQKVKIALQIEGGGRVIGEYSSEDTLDKIIDKARDKLQGTVSDGHEPVIIYMRQEIIGLELLSKTTLKGWIDFSPREKNVLIKKTWLFD